MHSAWADQRDVRHAARFIEIKADSAFDSHPNMHHLPPTTDAGCYPSHMPKQLMQFLRVVKAGEGVAEISEQILHEYKLLSTEHAKAASEDDSRDDIASRA